MRYPNKLTYRSIIRFIKETSKMYTGKDQDGTKKYVDLRTSQLTTEDHPGTINRKKNMSLYETWKNVNCYKKA